jgi:hypothetical protein
MPVFCSRSLLTWNLFLGFWLIGDVRADGQASGPQTIVFVANGAGGGTGATDSLEHVVRKWRLPIQVETVRWASGSLFDDIRDQKNHQRGAEALARKVWACQASNPGARICMLSHSAGVEIILGAVERLPPGVVSRVIILAAGCSRDHDLRPALARVSEGIDVHFSTQDNLLDTLVQFSGTTDGQRGLTAGEYGFSVSLHSPEDAALYSKLRQYRYSPALAWTGHQGGHWGCLWPCFVRTYLVPALLGSEPLNSGR